MKKLLLLIILLINVNILLSQFVAWRGEPILPKPECESFVPEIEVWGGFGVSTIDECVAINAPITDYSLVPHGPGWFGDFTDKVYFYDGSNWNPNPNLLCGEALPIDLVSFDGEVLLEMDPIVLLKWTVASQVNNDYFEVQRSLNLNEWELVDSVTGAGTINNQLSYSIVDYNPNVGYTYYRLKQVDYDGKSETFYPIAIEVKGERKHIIKTIDLYGNEVNQQGRGFIIHVWNNGTTTKTIK